MKRFSADRCISHSDEDVYAFVDGYLRNAKRVLFIGTVGLEPNSLFFPRSLKGGKQIDFRFVVERRRTVSSALATLGETHRKYLTETLPACTFSEIDIIATDGATVAGRNAVATAQSWNFESYSDIVVDATGMSRGNTSPLREQ